jgi:non-heme chloroperoxidase
MRTGIARKLLLILAAIVLAAVLIVAALIAFGTRPVPVANATTGAFKGVDFSTLPPMEHYLARDRASLGYRRYQAKAGAVTQPVVVLLHGASDSGVALHPLAGALSFAGVTVYVPQLRGHGDSLPRGDVRYIGQLEDDLVDFAAVLHQREGKAQLRLAGFSAGGGLALRFASGAHAALFSDYLLLSPGISQRPPIARAPPPGQAQDGVRAFAVPYVPRLIGISIAEGVGIHAFDGLPVIGFAVPPDSRLLTRSYSMRLLLSLFPADYRQAIAALHVPTTVIIGDADEFTVAIELLRAFHEGDPAARAIVLPGLKHLDLIQDPVALEAIRRWATT